MVVGLLVAAGVGSRVGFRKQYALLAGKPMWFRSAQALMEAGVEALRIVVPVDDVVMVERSPALLLMAWRDRVQVVAGGASRADSVRLGLESIVATTRDDDVEEQMVVIHDAARPFVTVADVKAVIRSATESGAAMLGRPCADTMKRVRDESGCHWVETTVSRRGLWHAETPQVARLDWLLASFQTADETKEVTDDASLLEQSGYPMQVIASTAANFKVTTASDLVLAEWLAERKWGAGDADRSGN